MPRYPGLTMSPTKSLSKWPRWRHTCLNAAKTIQKSCEQVLRAGRRTLTTGYRSRSPVRVRRQVLPIPVSQAAALEWCRTDLFSDSVQEFNLERCSRFIVPCLEEARIRPLDPSQPLDARCLFNGCQGSVYEIQCQSVDGQWKDAVMKVPKTSKICIMDSQFSDGSPGAIKCTDQLWVVTPCNDAEDYFHLSNLALGDQVLEIREARANGASALRMAQLDHGENQRWKVDSQGRIVCAVRPAGATVDVALDIVGASDSNGASVVAYPAHGNDNQQWDLHWVYKPLGLVRIISRLPGQRALTVEGGDQVRKDTELEVSFLARWWNEPGLVQLQRVIWNGGTPKGIVLERLGKQLGRGTGGDDSVCILQDIRNGLVTYNVAGAARSLVPVAHMLHRLHHEGYVYNDLHDGNILQRLGHDSYKMIDLGSVTVAEHWTTQLGPIFDGRWSKNRDWRAFAVALLGLLCGGRQLNIWDLVGTNSCTKTQAGIQCAWSSPIPDWDAGSLPGDVSTLLAETSAGWTRTESLNVSAVLVAIFSPMVNDADICMKLRKLAGVD